MPTPSSPISDAPPPPAAPRVIRYAEGERQLRRPRDGVTAEMAEAHEEADAIFGTEQEMAELLDFTRGGAEEYEDMEGEEGGGTTRRTTTRTRTRMMALLSMTMRM